MKKSSGKRASKGNTGKVSSNQDKEGTTMTKKEIIKELKRLNISFSKKASKDTLAVRLDAALAQDKRDKRFGTGTHKPETVKHRLLPASKDVSKDVAPESKTEPASLTPEEMEAYKGQCPTFGDCDTSNADCVTCKKDSESLFNTCLAQKAPTKRVPSKASRKIDAETGLVLGSKKYMFVEMLREATKAGTGLQMSAVKEAGWNDRSATFYDCFNKDLIAKKLGHRDGKTLYYGPGPKSKADSAS